MNRVLLLAFLVAINSCTVEKRLYNRGFHVEWRVLTHSNSEKQKPDFRGFSESTTQLSNPGLVKNDKGLREVHVSEAEEIGIAHKMPKDTILPDVPVKNSIEREKEKNQLKESLTFFTGLPLKQRNPTANTERLPEVSVGASDTNELTRKEKTIVFGTAGLALSSLTVFMLKTASAAAATTSFGLAAPFLALLAMLTLILGFVFLILFLDSLSKINKPEEPEPKVEKTEKIEEMKDAKVVNKRKERIVMAIFFTAIGVIIVLANQ